MLLLRFFHHNDTVSIFILLLFIIAGSVCVATLVLSRNFTLYYIKAKIHSTVKKIFLAIQLLGSLILALILPNNYLNEFPAINEYYTKNGLWIFASFVLLLLIFILVFGIAFSLLARLYTKEVEEGGEL